MTKRRIKSESDAYQPSVKRSRSISASRNPEATEGQALQEAANNSAQVKEAAYWQTLADTYALHTPADVQKALNNSVYAQAGEAELAGENALSIGRMDKGWDFLLNNLQIGEGGAKRHLNANLRRGRGKALAETPLQVLDVPGIRDGEDHVAGWTMDTNDAFIRGGIDNKAVFKIWSHLNDKELELIRSDMTFDDISAFFNKNPEQKRQQYPTLWSPFDGGSASITVRELTQIRDAGYEMGLVIDDRGAHMEAHKDAETLKNAQSAARKKYGLRGVVKAVMQQRERRGTNTPG